MTTVDTLMMLLFPFLDVIPFTLPRYWVFRDRLRVPFRYILLIQLVMTAIYSGVFCVVNLGGLEAASRWTTIMRYCFMLLYLAMAFLLIRERFSKLMFTWLLFISWQFFVLGTANFIEIRFFPEVSVEHPYLVYNIARVVLYLLTCPVLLPFFYHTVADAMKLDDVGMWRQFWKIPLFSTLFGMLYCTVSDVYAYASWQFLLSRYLMLLGACYASYVALKVMEATCSRTQLEEALKYAAQSLLTQEKQFDSLSVHMEETRRARHDLRQHLAAVQSYIERDDKAGLAEYIDLYRAKLPVDTEEYFCANTVVNAIISYYAAQARDAGIEFTAQVEYPKDFPVNNTDVTVLLGNLLENAVEACKRESAEGQVIKLRVKRRGCSTLMVMVDNTCRTPVAFSDGILLSSKREGVGMGVASIREIAARYGGAVQFKQENGMFCASVMLSITPADMDGTVQVGTSQSE